MPPTCAFTSEAIAFEFAPLTMLSALRRYPYMACEVICCDIGEIIDTLVESSDGAIIEQLFSLLQLEEKLVGRIKSLEAKLDAQGRMLDRLLEIAARPTGRH